MLSTFKRKQFFNKDLLEVADALPTAEEYLLIYYVQLPLLWCMDI